MKCMVNNNNRQALLVEENFGSGDLKEKYKVINIEEVSAENLINKFPTVQEWFLIPTEETRDVMEGVRINLHLKNKATRIKERNESSDVYLKKFGLI